MLIDTHAHLNFNAFKGDFAKIIENCLKNDLWVVNVGTKYETSKKAVEIAESHENGVFAAIGLHPVHLETGLVKIKNDDEEIEIKTKEEEFDYEKYKALGKSKKVVAIGEVGLDYYYKPKSKIKLELFKEKQKKVLLEQIDLAIDLNLPVIFHCRVAHNDLIKILENAKKNNKPVRGVIHSFTGNLEQAQKFIKLGFYLGFNGLIFKLSWLDEVIQKTPLENIVFETDCPYLTPPLPADLSAKALASVEVLARVGRVEGRNEPSFVKYTINKV